MPSVCNYSFFPFPKCKICDMIGVENPVMIYDRRYIMELTSRMNHSALTARTAAAGSMVLLKNTGNTLPLRAEGSEPLPVAVFGVGQIFTACCSEQMQPWRTVNVLDALCAGGRVRPDGLLAHKYREWCLAHAKNEEMPLSRLSMEELAENSAAAVVVVTRTPEDYRTVLTADECEMVRTVCAAFTRTVLVLNTPGWMELGELAQTLPAIVFMGVAGQEGGAALADILTGEVMPSGRLAHSWPLTLAQFDEAAGVMDGFCGYRWFDSFGRDVLYPFGYGLGYGRAELQSVSTGLDGCDVVVTAEVANTGSVWPVQEVVQVYFSTPAAAHGGAIYQLACFRKTRPLEAGEKQTITLRFPVTKMAVFRESASAFVLEEGYYDIRVGVSSRATYIAGSLRLTRSAVVQAITPMQMADRPDRARTGAGFTYSGEGEELAAARKRAIRFSDRSLPRLSRKKGQEFTGCRPDGREHTLTDVLRGWCSPFQLVASMDDYSLRALVYDFGTQPSSVPGALGASAALERYEIPALSIAAGSEGLHLQREIRNDETDKVVKRQNCTAFPSASLLACSFDPDLIRSVGAAIGREMSEYGVDLWLAPCVNLLRTPRQTGFAECWSEDPVVSGLCARAIADGVRPFGAPVLRSGAAEPAALSQSACRGLYALGFEIACGAYPAVLIPAAPVNGELCGEDGALARSMIVDWKFRGMFLADNERYTAEPDRVTLEKSALRILRLMQERSKTKR